MASLACHAMLPTSAHGQGPVTATAQALPVHLVCLSSTFIFACILLAAVTTVAAADVRYVSGMYADGKAGGRGGGAVHNVIRVIEGSTGSSSQRTISKGTASTIATPTTITVTDPIAQRSASRFGENHRVASHWSFLQSVKYFLGKGKHGQKFLNKFGYSRVSLNASGSLYRNTNAVQYSNTKDDTYLGNDKTQEGQLGTFGDAHANTGQSGGSPNSVAGSRKRPGKRVRENERATRGKTRMIRHRVTGGYNSTHLQPGRWSVDHASLSSKRIWILPGSSVANPFPVWSTSASTWPLYGKGAPYSLPVSHPQTRHHTLFIDSGATHAKPGSSRSHASNVDQQQHPIISRDSGHDDIQQPHERHFRSVDINSNVMTQTPKRKPRSVDNDLDGSSPISEDVLLSEALHHIEELRSQTAPCPNGSRIILLKPMKLSSRMFFPVFAEVVNKTVQMANTISDLLLVTDKSPEFFLDLFFVMTQSLVETGPQVRGCAIAVNLTIGAAPAAPTPAKPQASTDPSVGPPETPKNATASYRESLFPYAYRTQAGEVVVTDLSKVYRFNRTNWYSYHVNRSTDGLLRPRDRIFTDKTDVGVLSPYLGRWSKVVSVAPQDGFWAKPYYDCLLENWVIQYSVPFYQQRGNRPEFKGVVLLEANLENIPINQCADDGGLFSGSHRCIRSSTEYSSKMEPNYSITVALPLQKSALRIFSKDWGEHRRFFKCKNIPSTKLQAGNYKCVCKEGYRFPTPNSASQFFEGRAVERAYLDFVRNISSNYTNDFSCMPMPTTPPSTTPLGGEGEPIVAFDFLARGIPLGIQSFCMTVSVVIGIVILCFRKTKVMRSSIWVLLEMLLFGAILLYATVVIQYFEPTTLTCLLLPWCREMGFAIVYGVLVLKIYRILAEFQSRKAHRVHVRDKDLLKYLAVILTVVIAYMSAWTAVNMDHLSSNSTILERLHTKDNKAYTLCRAMWWDYVIEAGEFIFLCFGIYMCYCVRSAPTEYSEGRFITGAISYEAAISTIFYVLRHLWWYKMHPDHLFLMFFLRCQLTVTVVLLIILGPKLWYAHRPPDEDHGRSRAYSQSDVQDSSSPETMKLNVGISSNGDVEVGEISLTEMDPEDIRAELKRLYTQLQIYKTKTMRKDNPHISKRRGGRKQTHRRFSLQAFHHKHRHHHDHDHEHEMSKTPEESTNSAEAMAFTIEPSVKEDPNEGRSVPSVSFKPGHK